MKYYRTKKHYLHEIFISKTIRFWVLRASKGIRLSHAQHYRLMAVLDKMETADIYSSLLEILIRLQHSLPSFLQVPQNNIETQSVLYNILYIFLFH